MLRSSSLGYSGNGRNCAENRGNKLRAASSIYAAMVLAKIPLFHTISHFATLAILLLVIYRFWCCFFTTDVRFLLTFHTIPL